MKRSGKFFSVIADLMGVAAFIGIFLLILGDYDIPANMNIHSFLVGILSAIITLLVAWNIYSTIDTKGFKSKLESLKTELERHLNYAHNKMDCNKADTYAFLCQSAYIQLSNSKEYIIKEQCLMMGINAIKIYSNIPETHKEINAIIDSMLDMLDHTSHLKLDKTFCRQCILECGAIRNRDNIANLDNLIEKIDISAS